MRVFHVSDNSRRFKSWDDVGFPVSLPEAMGSLYMVSKELGASWKEGLESERLDKINDIVDMEKPISEDWEGWKYFDNSDGSLVRWMKANTGILREVPNAGYSYYAVGILYDWRERHFYFFSRFHFRSAMGVNCASDDEIDMVERSKDFVDYIPVCLMEKSDTVLWYRRWVENTNIVIESYLGINIKEDPKLIGRLDSWLKEGNRIADGVWYYFRRNWGNGEYYLRRDYVRSPKDRRV